MSSISMETAQNIARVWDNAKSLADAMRMAGIDGNDSRTHRRYRRMTEEMLGITLPAHNPQFSPSNNWPKAADHIHFDHPYTVVIFSDAHFWPSETGPAYWGLLEVLEKLQPEVVIDNGDSFDGASISRHAPIMFEELPTLAEEYKCCQAHLDMIIEAAGDAELYRNVGNHDLRFEARLASQTPQMQGMPCTTISELFPRWKHNYSLVLQDDTIVMHKYHSGMHASWNNVLKGGKSIVTGHTHRLGIRPYDDYSGRRYGIETGTLADPHAPQFSYCLDTPKNWQPGFVVLEFDEHGMHPETAELIGNRVRFRGEYFG